MTARRVHIHDKPLPQDIREALQPIIHFLALQAADEHGAAMDKTDAVRARAPQQSPSDEA